MEENKNIDFAKIRKILEKNNDASTMFFVFLCVFSGFTLTFFGTFFIPYIIKDFSIFKAFFILFWFGLLAVFWYCLIKGGKFEKHLLQHINNGTIILKTPKITKFEYYYDSDSDGHSESGYIVFANDGIMEYKSPRIMNSFFTGEGRITIDKDYYIQRNIPYSLKDPSYLKSSNYAKTKELEQQIEALKDQCKYVDDKEKKKLNKEIMELENERILLLPHHLVSRGATYVMGTEPICTECYIGDEINVFVDSDNQKNYIMEI